MRAFEYDRIGLGYAASRRPDRRIARQLEAALGGAASVLNVGAGTGSYEPRRARVVAVEPSLAMVAQRTSAAPVVRAVAEALPFAADAFGAALAVLTIHHWRDWRLGVAELQRVAARVVLLTWDPDAGAAFWLFEYFPGILARDRLRFATVDALCAATGGRSNVVPIPFDCVDGFLGSAWRRPEAYLDAQLRRAISGFAMLPSAELDDGVARLAADVRSGAWERRHGGLLREEALDLGYRIVVAERARRRRLSPAAAPARTPRGGP